MNIESRPNIIDRIKGIFRRQKGKSMVDLGKEQLPDMEFGEELLEMYPEEWQRNSILLAVKTEKIVYSTSDEKGVRTVIIEPPARRSGSEAPAAK